MYTTQEEKLAEVVKRVDKAIKEREKNMPVIKGSRLLKQTAVRRLIDICLLLDSRACLFILAFHS